MAIQSIQLKKLVLLVTAVVLAAAGARAYDLTLGTNIPPITFHGFASQGFLLSDQYSYLADDTKNGSFQFTEIGLNASINPFPRTRIAVQGFDFDVGNVGQYDPFLDYALIEYTVNDEVGIRAGRIRRPAGIYNSIQDIDLARTFVLLPQGMYDARWRDWSASLDGGDVFGSFSLHKAGELTYEAYGGEVNMSDNGGVARYVEAANDVNSVSIDSTPTFGGQLWYNTPVDGLRFGASVAYMSGFGLTSSSVTEIPVGPGVYVPGYVTAHSVGDVFLQQYSAEYLWRNWTFQAEYSTYDLTGQTDASIRVPAAHMTIPNVSSFPDNPDTWYGAVSYRINKRIEVGAYYTQWKDNQGGERQNDAALSLRLDLTDWWIFKIEGHWLEGNGLLRDGVTPYNGNADWFMLAVKSTVSF